MHNFVGSRSQSHTMLWSVWVLFASRFKMMFARHNHFPKPNHLSTVFSFCGSSSCHISNRNVKNYFKWALHTSISSIWSIEIVSLMWKCRNRINFQLNPLIFVKPNFDGSVCVFLVGKVRIKTVFLKYFAISDQHEYLSY